MKIGIRSVPGEREMVNHTYLFWLLTYAYNLMYLDLAMTEVVNLIFFEPVTLKEAK